VDTDILDQIVNDLRALPRESQAWVLQFTRALAASVPRGVPGTRLLCFAGTMSDEDAVAMRAAIEQGCEGP
jgi:hypothetical protein